MRTNKRALSLAGGVAIVIAATAIALLVPGEGSANIGGRAEVRMLEVVWAPGGAAQARFHTVQGIMVPLDLKEDEIAIMVDMAQALAQRNTRMFVDLERGDVERVSLMAGS